MTNAFNYSAQGKALEKVALPKNAFDEKVVPQLLAQAVRVFLSNQRKASAKTLTRSMVSKTTAKMFKQKGTGNARHGSYAAPIFVGGGIAFGPTGEQNYERKMPKAMAKKALAGALSTRAADKKVYVISGVKDLKKTSEAAVIWNSLENKPKTAVVLTASGQKNVDKAFRNIAGIEVIQISRLNSYDVLSKAAIVATAEAISELETLFK